VVGKQSVGKSSLLQSLTDIPFPVGLELTTQFATRIVSRRTPPGSPDTIQASIEHGDINPFAERSDDSSSNSFNEILQTLDEKCFKELIKKVRQRPLRARWVLMFVHRRQRRWALAPP
jgi:hypothetical protein